MSRLRTRGDAEIRGRVFMDSDDDSQDNNNGDEMGIFGVVVELLDDAGNVVASTLTGPDGGYAFTGLDAGTYAVDFRLRRRTARFWWMRMWATMCLTATRRSRMG